MRQDKTRLMSIREIFRGFLFGSCKLDSIDKGLEMVQFAEGDVVDRWPVDGERRWLK